MQTNETIELAFNRVQNKSGAKIQQKRSGYNMIQTQELGTRREKAQTLWHNMKDRCLNTHRRMFGA